MSYKDLKKCHKDTKTPRNTRDSYLVKLGDFVSWWQNNLARV